MISIHVPECEWQIPKLSNQALLIISIGLFLSFAVAQLLGSVLSDSLSLLGDSICMLVDVSSYICNSYVEWYKSRNHRITFGSRIVTELIIPFFSVSSLIAITIYISIDALKMISHPPSKNIVNVDFLYGFSVINLLVDIVCNWLFYQRREEVFREQSIEIPKLSLDTTIPLDEDDEEFGRLEDEDSDLFSLSAPIPSSSRNTNTLHNHKSTSASSKSDGAASACYNFLCRCSTTPSSTSDPSSSSSSTSTTTNNTAIRRPTTVTTTTATSIQHLEIGSKSNLNMLSAFTHILGDTFRTIATFTAASISSLTGIDGDICDAWAALLVSITIIFLCLMLIIEIKDAAILIWEDSASATSSSYSSNGLSPSSNSNGDMMRRNGSGNSRDDYDNTGRGGRNFMVTITPMNNNNNNNNRVNNNNSKVSNNKSSNHSGGQSVVYQQLSSEEMPSPPGSHHNN